MLDNYEKLKNGIIKQKDIVDSLPSYNIEYVNERYNSYGEKGLQMAYLRLGVLLGALGKPNLVAVALNVPSLKLTCSLIIIFYF